MQINIKDLIQTKREMEQDMKSDKKSFAELVNQKVPEALQQQNRSVPTPPETLAEKQNETTKTNLDIMTASQLEANEQYIRRDCLLFFRLHETGEENTTEK